MFEQYAKEEDYVSRWCWVSPFLEDEQYSKARLMKEKKRPKEYI